jgi:NAD-dependent dihydropyrimidine dehydrogenase PreA subunit
VRALTVLSEHPTVKRVGGRRPAPRPEKLDAAELRSLCLEAGADDVGFVALDHPEIAGERASVLALFPAAKALISVVSRMSRENIRTPMRSIANLEFHHTTDAVNEIIRTIALRLEEQGVRAINGGAAGFPMEADRWPGKMWLVSHKPVAVAAGLGRMGIHRNVIHPKFGNFILLGTLVLDAEISEYAQALDYNPCLECKLCVAACPTGAIAPDGHFDFSACYSHNYREFMGGFGDWVETIAASDSAKTYRQSVSQSETVSMWQSLSFGANYKAAYCMSVCPAGEDVIGPFLAERRGYVEAIVKPLREKAETVYVVQDSDAEAYVPRHFPNKTVKRVANGLSGQSSIAGFLRGLPIVFQRGRSEGVAATYHFTFTGKEEAKATVEIRDKTLRIREGHEGSPHLRVTADSETWLRFLRKEASLPLALLRRKIRIKGPPRLLIAFGKCFPS